MLTPSGVLQHCSRMMRAEAVQTRCHSLHYIVTLSSRKANWRGNKQEEQASDVVNGLYGPAVGPVNGARVAHTLQSSSCSSGKPSWLSIAHELILQTNPEELTRKE